MTRHTPSTGSRAFYPENFDFRQRRRRQFVAVVTPAAQEGAAADTAPLVPIDPWYSLASASGATTLAVGAVRRGRVPGPLGGNQSSRRMERERALELLRGGADSVERWNRWRRRHQGPFDLTHANLARANLSGANLANVDLHASDLSEATLIGANLEGSDLHRSNLKLADLSRAVLRGADLHAANLSRASLFGADLSKANVRRTSFRNVEADAATTWPQGFEPGLHGIEPWPAA